MGDVLGEIEDVVQPGPSARVCPRAGNGNSQPRRSSASVSVIIRTLFDRFDVAHTAVRIMHVGQQFGKRRQTFEDELRLAVK